MTFLKDQLSGEYSRAQMLDIVDYVGQHEEHFEELMALFTKGPPKITQRAAWPLSYCVEKHPGIAKKYLPTFLHQLEIPTHNAVTRNTLRLLQFMEITGKEAGKAMSLCFDLLIRPKEPVANKAFAMTILGNMSQHYPEIKNELLICIEDQIPNASPGFLARAKKVKKQLEKDTPG